MTVRATLGVSLVLVLAGCPGTFNQPLYLPMKFGPREQVVGRAVLHNTAADPVYVYTRTSCGGSEDKDPTEVSHDQALAVPFIRERVMMSTPGTTSDSISFGPTTFIGPPPGASEVDKGVVLVSCDNKDRKRMVELELEFEREDDEALFVSGWKARGRKPLAGPTVVLEIDLTGICDTVITKARVRLVHDCADLDEAARPSLPECR